MSYRGGGGRGGGGGGRGEYYKNKYGGGGRGGGGGGGGGSGGGRGEYYKNKYGGGGRGGGGRQSNDNDNYNNNNNSNQGGPYSTLIQTLNRIDNKSYPAYHDIESIVGWRHEQFVLHIGRAQSDSFAPPTRVRVVVPSTTAQFPIEAYKTRIRAVALGDYLSRKCYESCVGMGAEKGAGGGGWSGPKGGDVKIAPPGQHVLEQSGVRVTNGGDVICQFTVNLPARGRTILGQKAREIFERVVPRFVSESLVYGALNAGEMQRHILSVEDQQWLRREIVKRGLVAFVVNGAVLPRMSGADDRPMTGTDVVLFQSPKSLEVDFTLPNLKKKISGMGIPKGVTLIVGGGFHGKSTLLAALQVGVYDKIPGDGREFVVCDETSVKIRAEDGRMVKSVDISGFINNLPLKRKTTDFSTGDASGSTSQATNIVEAIEVGATTLLVDEDTCATNFMIRDQKMMTLVAPDKEPITPFIQKIRPIYHTHGISSILVIGGCGDYFSVADHVIMMDNYACRDVTRQAKDIVKAANEAPIPSLSFEMVKPRLLIPKKIVASGKVKVNSKTVVSYGEVELNLNGLEQIVCKEQTEAIALCLKKLGGLGSKSVTLKEILEQLNGMWDEKGKGLDDVLAEGMFHGALARPRLLEVAGAINRLRSDGSVTQN